MPKDLDITDFKTTIRGRKTDLFFLENRNGIRAAITNYGARIVAIWVEDAWGEPDNIVAGYDSITGYIEHDEIYLGAIVGRYANRIKGASITLNGKEYQLAVNDGRNQLHGGGKGFHAIVWDAYQPENNRLVLKWLSEDGEEGYPGNLNVKIVYTFTDEDELRIEYSAVSDKDTVVNFTNHAYFNLGGEQGNKAARNHHFMINADHYIPVFTDLTPIGELKEVAGSPFDFRKMRSAADIIDEKHPQIIRGNGYDHNFVLNKENEQEFSLAARVVDPSSGREMNVKTIEPGLQFFECVFDEELELNVSSAFCLETQHFPDSPNHPHFPSTLLKAGDKFYSKTGYSFSVSG